MANRIMEVDCLSSKVERDGRMKIQSVNLKNFMIFDNFDVDLSPNINIICGSNSTGKTALIKLIYSLFKAWRDNDTEKENKERINDAFAEKLRGVFRPENKFIGRLVRRKQGSSQCNCKIFLDDGETIEAGFGSKAEKNFNILNYPPKADGVDPQKTAIYIPPKEIISATENFRSLYEDMHIAFEETYYDLARLLDRPLKKGPNSAEQKQVLDKLSGIMQGNIVQKENKFYLRVSGKGEFEMGLVSEGYRKLATIVYLIMNGSLNANSVLFWDEPETNMNPKMIYPLVEVIMQLAKLGVQVFITTHDYFLLQYFNLASVYHEANPNDLKIKFISLYRPENGDAAVQYEEAAIVSDLEHNTIMEEFDAIYDREQGIIYDQIRKRN